MHWEQIPFSLPFSCMQHDAAANWKLKVEYFFFFGQKHNCKCCPSPVASCQLPVGCWLLTVACCLLQTHTHRHRIDKTIASAQCQTNWAIVIAQNVQIHLECSTVAHPAPLATARPLAPCTLVQCKVRGACEPYYWGIQCHDFLSGMWTSKRCCYCCSRRKLLLFLLLLGLRNATRPRCTAPQLVGEWCDGAATRFKVQCNRKSRQLRLCLPQATLRSALCLPT